MTEISTQTVGELLQIGEAVGARFPIDVENGSMARQPSERIGRPCCRI